MNDLSLSSSMGRPRPLSGTRMSDIFPLSPIRTARPVSESASLSASPDTRIQELFYNALHLRYVSPFAAVLDIQSDWTVPIHSARVTVHLLIKLLLAK